MSDIDDIIAQRQQQQADAIERASEKMLGDSTLGVLVEQWSDGAWKVSLSADVEPQAITYTTHAEPLPV